MEDIWKNITLTSRHSHPTAAIKTPSTAATHPPTLRIPTLHDYLSRSLDHDHPPPPPHEPVRPEMCTAGLPGSPPTTALRLDSARLPDEATGPRRRKFAPLCSINSDGGGCFRALPRSFISSLNFPTLDALASSSEFPDFRDKRVLLENEDSPGDRRHKRMMKNRESAARSRARKQAYTYELELAVTQLMEENARLKRQLRVASAAEPTRKKTLYRTSTAPF